MKKTFIKFYEKTRKLRTLEGDVYIIDVFNLPEAMLFIPTDSLEISKSNDTKVFIKNLSSGVIIKGKVIQLKSENTSFLKEKMGEGIFYRNSYE